MMFPNISINEEDALVQRTYISETQSVFGIVMILPLYSFSSQFQNPGGRGRHRI